MDLPERALSIRQPWADAIVHHGKDIENRDWSTRFRGPVCIHAARAWGEAERQTLLSLVEDGLLPDARHGPLGGIIGIAEIVDCVDASSSPWFYGRHGFVLRNARPVPFIPVRGALSFFRWRDRVLPPAA